MLLLIPEATRQLVTFVLLPIVNVPGMWTGPLVLVPHPCTATWFEVGSQGSCKVSNSTARLLGMPVYPMPPSLTPRAVMPAPVAPYDPSVCEEFCMTKASPSPGLQHWGLCIWNSK